MKKNILLLFVFTVLAFPFRAPSAETPSISVLYFTNLGSADAAGAEKNYIGKALAEFSAAELSAVKGITIVERNTLEKIMKEMELSVTGIIDENTAPKIGKLLGATYILDGSYLVSGKKCDAAYKIISTEKGSILKAGNVSGSSSDIGALVRSLAISEAASLKELFPGIDISALSAKKSGALTIDSAEKFGKALDMDDSGNHAEAAELLKNLSSENPDYRIFKKALDDLEKRIRQYDKARETAMKIEEEQPLTWNQFMKLSTSYGAAMNQTKLYNLCVKVKKNPPELPEGYIIDSAELIDYYMISALHSLKKFPETIHDGEIFLKEYPSSVYYQNVKMFIRLASDSIKETESNKKTIKASLDDIDKKFSPQGPSTVHYYQGLELYTKKFYPEAVDHFRKIKVRDLEKLSVTGDAILFYMFQCHAGVPDRKAAEKTLKTMETMYPDSQYLSGMKTQAEFIPE